MARVLFVGQQPETVDFTNPMLPPGMNAERIHAGITLALKQMAERGWHADLCLLRPDETAGPDVERRLKAQTYDCVVIVIVPLLRFWCGARRYAHLAHLDCAVGVPFLWCCYR